MRTQTPSPRRAADCLLGTLLVVLFACSKGDGPTKPPEDPCGPAALASRHGDLSPQVNAATTLKPLGGTTIRASALSGCLDLAADAATYIVVPQFATSTGPKDRVSYELAAAVSGAQAGLAPFSPLAARRGGDGVGIETAQQRFDRALRNAERELAPGAARSLQQWRVSANVVASSAAPPPTQVGSTRQFKVLATLDPNASKFETVTAELRFAGDNILVYVDQAAPAAPEGFTDAQLTDLGRVFDRDLYEIDVRTFGAPSDIDGNGRVIVLLTPTVNRLTPAANCSTTGYVSGFFYGLDLIPTRENSNKGEIFYAMVPDPAGRFGCAHAIRDVESITPATFLHEFQHMISWNQHVIVRNGKDEVLWLNEGLSHIAEEMGSRYYESKPNAYRTDPRQLFPDSAEGFIIGLLFNSYAYLRNSSNWSVTQFIEGGSLEERGGAWLFLRWLGDQKDSTIYKKLVQTNLTGIANVQTQAGEDFSSLFGDFSIALYTDSLPGTARGAVPQRYRFASRNLRMLYDALYRATSDRARVPRPFPIQLKEIKAPGTQGASMVPGTSDFFRVQMPSTGTSGGLRFSEPGGAPLGASLGAQVTVFRCPSAAACP